MKYLKHTPNKSKTKRKKRENNKNEKKTPLNKIIIVKEGRTYQVVRFRDAPSSFIYNQEKWVRKGGGVQVDTS